MDTWSVTGEDCGKRYFDLSCCFDLDLYPMSLRNLTCIPLRYNGCANMNFLRKGCQKISSVIHTYKHADRQTDSLKTTIHNAALRVVRNQRINLLSLSEQTKKMKISVQQSPWASGVSRCTCTASMKHVMPSRIFYRRRRGCSSRQQRQRIYYVNTRWHDRSIVP